MPEEDEEPEAKEAEAEEEEVEEKVAKPKRAKVEKKKKIEKRIFTYYEVDEKGLTRLRPFCERCGPGFFMADHGNRFTCGHCGFTRYKESQG
jgi:small subunit ribosomal protein S27Ae